MFYYAMTNDNDFNIYQLFWIPILIYLIYFILFYNKIKSFYLDSINND